MPLKSFLIIALLLSMFTNFSHAQQAAIYRINSPTGPFALFIPSVKIGNRSYGNAWLDFEDDKHFVINRFVTLDDEQQSILNFLDNTPCSPAGNLEKVAAFFAYEDNLSPYCLQVNTITPAEGGSVFLYLLIEDNTVRYVEDTRLDGFGQCCFHEVGTLNTLQIGVYENNQFNEVTIPTQVDLELDYILRIVDPDGYVYEF